MFEKRLMEMERAFEEANIRIGEATWNTYSGEGTADLDGAQRQMAAVLSNADDREMVERSLAALDASAHPILERRLRIWRNCFHSARVDNDPEIAVLRTRLQKRIASSRFELDGRQIARSEIQKLLRNESDRALRRRAWRSMSALAAANREDLRHLIHLRNTRARAAGYADYPDMVYALSEIDPTWLQSMLRELEDGARATYSNLVQTLAGRLGVSTLAPWDLQFAMRQGFHLPDAHFPAARAIELLHQTARALGFKVHELPIRTLVRDIPFGGYNVAVRIPDDTRFLVNPSEGQGFYTTTFHEFGHSLQAVFTQTSWPILKEYEWVLGAHTAAYSEGMAETIGEFARRPDWLSSVAGISKEVISRYLENLLPAQMVTRQFDLLLQMRIELAAYTETDQDMGSLERDLTREVRLLDFPEDEPAQWEANTWYTTYPVYWQNYVLASIIACQVQDALTERFGPDCSSCPDVADYLCAHFFKSGNAVSWEERIRNGTGRELRPDAYLRRIRMPVVL